MKKQVTKLTGRHNEHPDNGLADKEEKTYKGARDRKQGKVAEFPAVTERE